MRPTIMTVELPWPSRDLHPNARVHHMAKAKVIRRARSDAAWWAMAAGLKPMKAKALKVTAVFSPPDNRRRDTDGMLSSLKPALDGIADVIGVDDSEWEIGIRREEPREHGAVRIEIEVLR
jgi:crossover junction endodeoxyribonuclease RusA